MATFVLVPGACHGSWCYEQVAAILRAAGHDVHTPSFSGVGERAHLASQAINLSTHIRDVVALFERHDLREVVLCGHSYGGMVITGVAGQVGDRIRTLFYLDGCVPESGQSTFDLAGPERTLRMIEAAGATGTMMTAPSAEFFAVEPGNRARVDALSTPHPIACFIEKLQFTGREAEVTRRTFVLCAKYRSSVNYPTYEKVRRLEGWRALMLDCGHDAMVDAPDQLAALLADEVPRP